MRLNCRMKVEFADGQLAQVETDPTATLGHGPPVDRGFRKVVQFIRAAMDERDLYAMNSLDFEKVRGHQTLRTLRLNKQWRLFVELVGKGSEKVVRIVKVGDPH